MAYIKIVNGPQKGKRIDIDRDEVVLGRAANNAVVLDDESVSSRHCKITRDGRRFTLHDLDSTNGTRLNGTSVQTHQISPGDTIGAGAVELVLNGEDIEPYAPLPDAQGDSPVTVRVPATGKAQGAPVFNARRRRKWVGVTLAVLAGLLLVGAMALFLCRLFSD